MVCGAIQLTVDIMIIVQIAMYRRQANIQMKSETSENL